MKRIKLKNRIYLEYENGKLIKKYSFYPNNRVMWEENLLLGEKKVFDINGNIIKKIVSRNGISEILHFYSNGELFRRNLIDENAEEEYIEYYSKLGDLITKIKNSLNSDYSLIYDLISEKYLIIKKNKLYCNGYPYSGRVKYYKEIFLVEQSYNKKGILNGTSKISHYEKGLIFKVEWKDGVLSTKDDFSNNS